MTRVRAGETVEYIVTHLEMTSRPAFSYPPVFGAEPVALIHSENCPVWYFLNLYDAVGQDYEWRDLHELPKEELEAFVLDPQVNLYTYLRKGWPHGFFVLDTRAEGVTDLAYFGLVPEAVGTGQGTWLLQTAILMGWDVPGTGKLTVNTCTLDHPRALQQYQRHGFRPIGQVTRTRILTRDRDMPRSS